MSVCAISHLEIVDVGAGEGFLEELVDLVSGQRAVVVVDNLFDFCVWEK